MVTQNYTISTVKVATPPKVKMSQYDYGMRTITFAVVDGSGAAVDLTGKTVTVEGTRIDGHAFATTCTVADNAATFVDTVDMTNAAGDHPAELVVRQNDERLGTMNFIISVEPAAMDEGADITPEDLPLYQQLFKGLASAPMIYNTVSGDIASFSDGADGYPLKGLTVAVEPKQSGSGDPSPTNIRPISGWDEIEIVRTGKNLLESDGLIKTTNNVFIKNSDGSYTFTHVGSGLANRSSAQAPVNLPSGKTITVSFKYSGTITSALSIRFEASDGAYTDYSNLTLSGGTASCTLTLTKDDVGAEFYFGSGGVGEALTITDIQIEIGSTVTSYEPYSGETYTISLGETVYGGTLDVVEGKMVVDRKAVDLGDLSWTMSSTRFYSNLTDAIATKAGGDTNALCSSYRRVPYNNSTFATGNFCVCDSNFSGTKRCLFQNANIASVDDFKTSVTGQTLVYSLATHIEITLTPTQINTLLGVNNVYSDAGSVEVEYPADTKQFILNAIASALA